MNLFFFLLLVINEPMELFRQYHGNMRPCLVPLLFGWLHKLCVCYTDILCSDTLPVVHIATGHCHCNATALLKLVAMYDLYSLSLSFFVALMLLVESRAHAHERLLIT